MITTYSKVYEISGFLF